MRLAVALALAAMVSASAQSNGTGLIQPPLLVNRAPVVLRRVSPEHSAAARRARIEGTVVLYIEIGTDGRPRDIRVIKPLGYGLDEKAVEAVRRWRFRPGVMDNRRVATRSTIEVTFRLDSSAAVRV
jgi:TonB family protein